MCESRDRRSAFVSVAFDSSARQASFLATMGTLGGARQFARCITTVPADADAIAVRLKAVRARCAGDNVDGTMVRVRDCVARTCVFLSPRGVCVRCVRGADALAACVWWWCVWWCCVLPPQYDPRALVVELARDNTVEARGSAANRRLGDAFHAELSAALAVPANVRARGVTIGEVRRLVGVDETDTNVTVKLTPRAGGAVTAVVSFTTAAAVAKAMSLGGTRWWPGRGVASVRRHLRVAGSVARHRAAKPAAGPSRSVARPRQVQQQATRPVRARALSVSCAAAVCAGGPLCHVPCVCCAVQWGFCVSMYPLHPQASWKAVHDVVRDAIDAALCVAVGAQRRGAVDGVVELMRPRLHRRSTHGVFLGTGAFAEAKCFMRLLGPARGSRFDDAAVRSAVVSACASLSALAQSLSGTDAGALLFSYGSVGATALVAHVTDVAERSPIIRHLARTLHVDIGDDGVVSRCTRVCVPFRACA